MPRKSQFLSVLIVCSLLAAIGCAARKNLWGDPETGLILKYRMPEKQALQYRIANRVDQNMEMMGQAVQTQSSIGYVFSLNAKGQKNDRYSLAVTIDSMKIKVKAPQGELEPDVGAIVGKSFDMTLSAFGKEMDLSAAETLRYNMGPNGSRSIVSDFKALFPDLAQKPIKLGDSWTTRDTIDIKDNNSRLSLLFVSLNTLQGFESVDGLECVKVNAAVKGTLSGTGQQGGADLSFSGDIKASDTWYFAYQEGYFVRTTSEGTTQSTVKVSGPQEMSIPMTITAKFETALIK